ncbi:transcriptional regulator [Streptomyces sp. SID4928]|uniref:transcriptional regulator n=1 Tax=Streptomyces TaxID=1883 RepID=UPI0001C1A160|nr:MULTISPECIES: transcriptional regulator [Streptomyces]EGE39575.1 amino acid adenylation domain-containing protein [Streptomyces sp. ACT-1]MYR47666.1 transcriptional regulator [Streptomyces sp. SID4928]
MILPVPVTGVVGACLRDARERHMVLPEQAADALDISLPALLALEAGASLISPTGARPCP